MGVLQEWFGIHWWNSREFSLLVVVVVVMLPLVLLKRVGQSILTTTPNMFCFPVLIERKISIRIYLNWVYGKILDTKKS